MQILEAFEQKKYDSFLVSQNASVLQSWVWGEFQKSVGRKVWRLIITNNLGRLRGAATIVRMPLPRGKFYLYCPRGPVFVPDTDAEKIWPLFLDKLSDFLVADKPIFLRIDPLQEDNGKKFGLQNFGFKKINWEIQPKETLLLDLKQSEEDLLHQMKPKTRYNIRLAQKKGVEVVQTKDPAKLKFFWELMQETAKRDRFGAHPYNYYVNLLQKLGKENFAELFLAMYKSRPLASGIISYFGQTAVYLHGASSSKMRAVMAPYLVQWSAVLAAKKQGMKYYDFGGIAPENANKRHPWAGITRFKRGFCGKEISYIGAYDLVYNKTWYRIYKIARALNRFF